MDCPLKYSGGQSRGIAKFKGSPVNLVKSSFGVKMKNVGPLFRKDGQTHGQEGDLSERERG